MNDSHKPRSTGGKLQHHGVERPVQLASIHNCSFIEEEDCGAVDVAVGELLISDCTFISGKEGDPDYFPGVRLSHE